MVKMTSPYVPGFLAFREAGFLVEKIEKLRQEKPEIMLQAVLVDGNGILHDKSVSLSSNFQVYCKSIDMGFIFQCDLIFLRLRFRVENVLVFKINLLFFVILFFFL